MEKQIDEVKIEMVVKDGILKFADLPKVMAEFRKPFPAEAEQFSSTSQTNKGYDTAGYGYAWVSERLNDVVGFCWRIIEKEPTISEVSTKSGNKMVTVGIDVVLQLGNWENKEIEDTETLIISNPESPVPAETRTVKKTYRVERVFKVLAETPVGNGWHKAFALADAMKGAKTNGFKKAAGFFSLGNDAYKKMIDPENEAQKKQAPSRRPTPGVAPQAPVDRVQPAADTKRLFDMLAEKGVTTEEEGIEYMKTHHNFDTKSLRRLSEKQVKMCLALLLQNKTVAPKPETDEQNS